MEPRTPSRGGSGEKTTSRQRSAASKSRRDKSRPRTVVSARAKVVPKRLPEAEWSALLEAESGDKDVGGILAELLERVMVGCSRVNVARQVVPFVVAWARDAILHVIQWRFLARDEGDCDLEDGDGAWQEDEEPQPLTLDSWAQGTVPVLCVPRCLGEGEVSGDQTEDPPVVTEAGSLPTSPLWPVQVPTAGAILPMPATPCLELLPPDEVAVAPCSLKGKYPRARLPHLCPARPRAPCASLGQLKQGWYPPRSCRREVESSSMTWASSHVPPLPPSSCTSLPTIWPRPRPGGSGTIRGVSRLGPRSLPERWIRPQVEVLDPEPKALAQVQAAHGHSGAPPPGNSQLTRGLVTRVGTRLQGPSRGSPQTPSPVPLPLGSLLGSAQLAPGVTIRQGGSMKQEVEEEEEETKWDLRPICPTVPFPGTVAWQVAGKGES